MGLNGVVSGYPTSTNLPWVDGLSTNPRDLGCHSMFLMFLVGDENNEKTNEINYIFHIC